MNDEFSPYDVECLQRVFSLAATYMEFAEEEIPDYVFEEMKNLKDRVMSLIKQRTMS